MEPTASTAKQVVPLLQALSRAEELTQALAMRLDPITNHTQIADGNKLSDSPRTVTGRLHNLGDTLQYLLDNIEL